MHKILHRIYNYLKWVFETLETSCHTLVISPQCSFHYFNKMIALLLTSTPLTKIKTIPSRESYLLFSYLLNPSIPKKILNPNLIKKNISPSFYRCSLDFRYTKSIPRFAQQFSCYFLFYQAMISPEPSISYYFHLLNSFRTLLGWTGLFSSLCTIWTHPLVTRCRYNTNSYPLLYRWNEYHNSFLEIPP